MSKSLVKHILFFNILVFIAGIFIATSYANLEIDKLNISNSDYDSKVNVSEFLQSYNEKYNEDISDINQLSINNNSVQAEARNFYEEILQSKMNDSMEIKKESYYEKFNILIFASLSMHHQTLHDLFISSQKYPNSIIVFRGVAENSDLTEGITLIHSLINGLEPLPNIIIDPTMFKKNNIDTVPTIVIKKQGQEQARVSGLISPEWILNEIENDFRGDAGVKGNTYEIAEPDLIEVMKSKVAGIDWEQKKQNALNNFWKKQEFISLPVASKYNKRELDPSVLVTKDIVTASNEIIAKKGDVINPLDLRPFTQTVFIFDPTDKRQTNVILTIKDNIKTPRATFLVTSMDREKGWTFYKEITDLLDAPVFYLTPDIKDRFLIEAIPSVITADGRKFIIEELDINDKE